MTESGHWVLRHTQKKHQCPTPVGVFGSPLGDRGEVWQCSWCNQYWLINDTLLTATSLALEWVAIRDGKARRLIQRNNRRVAREQERKS